MGWLQFIAAIVEAAAWPAAVIVLVLLFKGQVRALLMRIREVSGPGGTGARFTDELERTREVAEGFMMKGGVDQPPTEFELDKHFFELVERFPEAAILYTYKELEALIDEHRRLLSKGTVRSPSITQFLASLRYIDEDARKLYERIRKLRNAAVHAPPQTITPGEAIEFRELSEWLKLHLEKAFKRMEEEEKKKPAYS